VFDGQANVIGLVDAAGTERARYTYDPYGAHDAATAVNGTLPDNPYRFASGRAVALNASNQVILYQFGERFYQRSTGRWTQQDNLESLGDPTQGNRYSYVGDDPVNNVDPTGQWRADWGVLTGTVWLDQGDTAALARYGDGAAFLEGELPLPYGIGAIIALNITLYTFWANQAVLTGGCLSVKSTGRPSIYYDEGLGCV
jgi:RHS repeat-associated protein